MYKCQECGKKFKTVSAAQRASNNGCPKCGGCDIDIDVEAKPSVSTVTRKTEISTGLRASFERVAAANGITVRQTYSNGGVTQGYEMTGNAETVRLLGRKFSYGEWRDDFAK